MAVTQATSRLEVLQARFQQKQMQEKEQKLLQLYDQQQQRAYQVVQKGSAGSTGSVSQQHSVIRTTTTTHTSSTSQGGKVRQMFDERRQTSVKGIDRSYPLEPLDNKPKKQNAITSNGNSPSKTNQNNTVIRQTVTVRRTARADINSSINGGKPVISYHEELQQQSFGNENLNGEYHDEDDSSNNRNGVHIEEITDDTIERNRMLAKIHLMEYDENLRHRVNNDLNSEQFPEDLMVDVPDKLPRKPIMKKLSKAEARLERFKNANAKRNNSSVTPTVKLSEMKKRSEPMFPSTRSTSRSSTIKSRPTETTKVQRPTIKPISKPLPIRDSKAITRKMVVTSDNKKPIEPNSPPISIEPAVSTKTVTPVRPVKSTEIELVQASKSIIQSPKPSRRVQKSLSPESRGEKSTSSTGKISNGRSLPMTPTKKADIVIRRGSANSKSPEPRPVRKSLQDAQRDDETVNAIVASPVLDEPRRQDVVDTSSLEHRSESRAQTGDEKSVIRNSPIPKKSGKSSVVNIDGHHSGNDSTANAKLASRKISTERTSATQNQKPSTTSPSPPRPASVLSTASSTTSSARGTSSPERHIRQMATKARTTARSPGATSASGTRGTPSVRNGPTAISSDALVSCKNCGRRFAQDRISLHEKICTKTGQKKRKQFDAASHRIQGTELEAYTKKGKIIGRQTEQRLKVKKPEANTKSNWRRKHEDFINAIRSAKQVQAHLAAGGKLSDLPPPPASDTSDYIQCPHCGRKFNQSAADRHIPKCATMMHNKPNPRAPPKPKR